MRHTTRAGPGVTLGLAAAFALALAACGGDDDDAKPAASTEQQAPASLVGKYTTELKPSDLPPDAPGELNPGSLRWTLTVANSGGVDDGPVFAIANVKAGSLEGPAFGVKGNVVLLHREECGAGAKPFYDNSYRYRLSGDTLTFTKVTNHCPDKVAETILTSEPWTKVN